MDATTSTIITAGIVAFVGLATTWLTNYFTSNRESKQWERQQQAEQEKRQREEKTAELDRRRETYQNALTHLSNLMSFDREDLSLPKEEQIKLIGEAQKWLNVLCLAVKAKDDAFLTALEEFTGSPLNNVEEMREAVLKLSTTDDLLFPDAAPSSQKKLPEPKAQEPTIHFSMQIDDDFRREQVINAGIQVPRIYNFTRPLSQLTQSQRQLLAHIYFTKHREIPGVVSLPMPTVNGPSEGRWQGKINPTEDNLADVLKLWEQDYKDAQNNLNKPAQS